jgi:hypothetical protein
MLEFIGSLEPVERLIVIGGGTLVLGLILNWIMCYYFGSTKSGESTSQSH